MPGKSRSEVVDSKTGEIVPSEIFDNPLNALPGRLSEDIRQDINSLDDYSRLTGHEIVDLSEVLESYDILNKESKERLVGRPIFLMDWRFNDSKEIVKDGKPAEFVSVLVMDVATGEKFILNDGSTGIYQQLLAITKRLGRRGGITCRNGLRKSEYTHYFDNGDTVNAVTYYLS